MSKKIGSIYATVAALLATTAWASNPSEMLLSGPIESVDGMRNTVTVLGHSVSLSHVDHLQVGQLVRVFGNLGGSAALGAAQLQNLGVFASGSEALYLKGRVTSVSPGLGRVTVGNAIVDYSALLAGGHFSVPGVGAIVEIVGTQPAGRGLVLASSLNTSHAVGVTGSGLTLGVTGSGLAEGVTGSGLTLGVTGSGRAVGVTGSGLTLGVTGSGLAEGVTGSGLTLGVTGSGRAVGVTGSGLTLGVTGSGHAEGVTGSGIDTL
jgi:hypothetical protein